MTKLFAIRRFRQFGKADEGQAPVLIALALVVLMPIAGLGLDVAFLRYQKQQMQKAADAGANAGASELVYGAPALAVVAPRNDTAADGFADDNSGTTVTANNPPQSGPFIHNTECVEVIIAQAHPNITVSQAASGVVGGAYEEGSGNISPLKRMLYGAF